MLEAKLTLAKHIPRAFDFLYKLTQDVVAPPQEPVFLAQLPFLYRASHSFSGALGASQPTSASFPGATAAECFEFSAPPFQMASE